MNAKPLLTKEELAWARKQAKKLGIKDPEVFLNMRWSEVARLAEERGYDWVIQDIPKKKPSKPARRPKSKKRPPRK